MQLLKSLKDSLRSKPTPAQQESPSQEHREGPAGQPDRRRAGAFEENAGPPGSPDPNRVIDWRVLFIGGDPQGFLEIQREMLALEPGWLCQRVEDGAGAAEILGTASFDGLCVDGRVPDAASVLNKLESQVGRMVCMVRCDVLDRTTVAQWNRSGVIPISQDCDTSALAAGLKRSRRLREWMADPAIKKLLPLLRKLPTAPRLYEQITAQLQSPNASIQTVAVLISQDPVMSAKILQVVNSAFFGMTQEVTDTAEAVMVLGTERIRSLILLAGVFSQYAESKCPGFSPEPVWGHSVQVAILARAIAFAETKDAKIAETAFTAGLLHDIGKLVLAGNLPEMYDTVRRMQESKQTTQREAELVVLGTTHAALGACLLGTWGLPLPILEAIAWHHTPEQSAEKGFSLLAAVHVANAFAQEAGKGSSDSVRDGVNVEFLSRIGLGDCLVRWRESCGLTEKPEEQTAEERIRRRREVKEN